MPYSKQNPPDWLKNLSTGAQEIGIEAFNKVLAETGDEEQARFASWTAIKAKYKKQGQEWVEMKEEVITLTMGLNDGAPEEFLIFPLGQITGASMEPFTVDNGSIESVQTVHKMKGTDTIIDYEHQTLTGGVAPAAGWVRDYFNNGQGLACKVTWTGRASEFIKNREYRYFSPVAGLDQNRRLIAIQSIALTNLPRGYNLTPLVMKTIEPLSNNHQESNMDKKKILELMGLPSETTDDKVFEVMSARLKQVSNNIVSQEVMTALSLKPDATVKEILDVINRFKTTSTSTGNATGNTIVASQEIMSELGLQSTASKSEAIATIRAIRQAQTTGISITEFEAMKTKMFQREADELVVEAMKAGKITAAQKDWAINYAKTDQAGFKMFVEKAPVVIIMKDLPENKNNRSAGDNLVITKEDRLIMKQMGVSEENMKKYYCPAGVEG